MDKQTDKLQCLCCSQGEITDEHLMQMLFGASVRCKYCGVRFVIDGNEKSMRILIKGVKA